MPPFGAADRVVDDVATLKALADPLRLGILNTLHRYGPQPLTVKEIAAVLGEPQTKLYRHVKQLEKAELIAVAGTRLVSGIVESRYQACQEGLRLSGQIFAADSPDRPEALAAMLAALDTVRAQFERDFLNDRIDYTPPRDGSAGMAGIFAHSGFRLRPERADRLRAAIRAALAEAAADEVGADDEGDAVELVLFTLLYEAKPPTG
ncbi:hypothetical protein GCM10009665_61870 [Kitasatospora nipponensis]|uniref:HTH arsR-type domain-containing protein n=1 Tax=Kitasatospora nipponensis TaxID=258049 RepID=A0ABN1WSX4_9ACTN